ncbi:MAG TPA: HAD family hydrolase [Gammaproteobacteria bacterium]|nr:HAD family hydrolase [Gammaproteobacteria bacterium]
MTKYDHIIVDFDGTLFDSHPAVVKSLEKTLLHFQLPSSPTLIESLIRRGLSLKSMLSELTSNAHPLMDEMIKYYLENHPEDAIKHGSWYPLALTFLESMCTQYTVWIVSNRQQTTLDAICHHFNITQPDRILGSTPLQAIKPNKMPFFELLPDKLTQPSIKRLVIGDTIVDISFAQALKCDAAWVEYGYGRWEDLNHLPLHFKWANMDEALQELNP